jgi:AGZA family xanthine/uracil permease-like MFS transporter
MASAAMVAELFAVIGEQDDERVVVHVQSFEQRLEVRVRVVYADPGGFAMAGLHLPGLIALSQGFMLSGIVWSAASAELIDQRFERAALWMLAGAALALFGFIHSGHLTPAGAVTDVGFLIGTKQALGYALGGLFFMLLWLARRRGAAASPQA